MFVFKVIYNGASDSDHRGSYKTPTPHYRVLARASPPLRAPEARPGGGGGHSLVVEHHVRQPDVLGWKPDFQHPVELLGSPGQTVVLPLLRTQGRDFVTDRGGESLVSTVKSKKRTPPSFNTERERERAPEVCADL